jgi:hypothetical protein
MSKGGSQPYPKSIEAEVHSIFCCLTGWPAPPPSPRAPLSPPGAPSRIPATQAPPPPLPPFQWPPLSRPLPSGPRPPPVLSAGSLFCAVRGLPKPAMSAAFCRHRLLLTLRLTLSREDPPGPGSGTCLQWWSGGSRPPCRRPPG